MNKLSSKTKEDIIELPQETFIGQSKHKIGCSCSPKKKHTFLQMTPSCLEQAQSFTYIQKEFLAIIKPQKKTFTNIFPNKIMRLTKPIKNEKIKIESDSEEEEEEVSSFDLDNPKENKDL